MGCWSFLVKLCGHHFQIIIMYRCLIKKYFLRKGLKGVNLDSFYCSCSSPICINFVNLWSSIRNFLSYVAQHTSNFVSKLISRSLSPFVLIQGVVSEAAPAQANVRRVESFQASVVDAYCVHFVLRCLHLGQIT